METIFGLSILVISVLAYCGFLFLYKKIYEPQTMDNVISSRKEKIYALLCVAVIYLIQERYRNSWSREAKAVKILDEMVDEMRNGDGDEAHKALAKLENKWQTTNEIDNQDNGQ